jgi:hypothetical protein
MISINHFRQELTEQMGRASASGAKDVLINSLDLCASIPKGNYAADSCCNAMQDEMKAGDVLLIDRNHTAGMTVRYFLPRVTMLCSTSAFAQTAKVPKVGGKPLVQITSKGPTG